MDNSRDLFLRYRLPALAWAGLIFTLSSIPHLSTPEMGIEWSDKLAHGVEYGIFGYLLARAIQSYLPHGSAVRISGWAIALGVLWALSDEFHQYFVPGREVSGTDFLADGVGVVVAQVFFWSRDRMVQRRASG